jgi:hypothetical protein
VSQRLSITLLENVLSNAERRAVRLGEKEVVPRLADVYSALPAITGKIELEYEGELIGGAVIARELIRRAAEATLTERTNGLALDEVIMWFDTGSALEVNDEVRAKVAREAFATVPSLVEQATAAGLPMDSDPDAVVACELILESLVARRKISRSEGGQYGRSGRRQSGLPPEYPESDQQERRRGAADRPTGAVELRHRAGHEAPRRRCADVDHHVERHHAPAQRVGHEVLHARVDQRIVDDHRHAAVSPHQHHLSHGAPRSTP